MQDQKKILVVEDNEPLREIVCNCLIAENYQVTGVENGERAWEALSKNDYSLIISDVRMPIMSGVKLLELVRSKKKYRTNPPFIFITGYSETPNSALLAKGADAIYQKPFEMNNLIKTVQEKLTPLSKQWGKKQGLFSKHLDKTTYEFKNPESLIFGRGGYCIRDTFPALYKSDEYLHGIISISDGVKELKIDTIGKIRWRKKSQTSGKCILGVEILAIKKESNIEGFRSFIEGKHLLEFIPCSTHFDPIHKPKVVNQQY